jgi:hypothetical protein
LFGENKITIKKTLEALLDARKDADPAVNTEDTFTSRHQIAGQGHNTKAANKPFVKIEDFIYLDTTLIDQNCIHEEINRRPHSRKACYHAVQNLFAFSLLPRNVEI